MTQTNHGGTNYQTQTGQDNTNFLGGEHHHYYSRPYAHSGAPFQAPPLPRPYIDRPEPHAAVKAKLLAEESATPGTLVVSAIFGLGGIGKSVLTAVLAHDPEVQAHFPDGILWATLGQQPDVLPFLSNWIQALRDYDYKPTTIDSASLHLRTLLYNKKVLLVVDDVWNPDHMEPFRVGGSQCQVLVTTREAKIPDSDRYDMDTMTAEQSLELLLQKAQCPNPRSTEWQQAETLAREVGYLPLALELAGAQIADGVLWSELLEDLQAEITCLEVLDDSNAPSVSSEKNRKRLSLVASLNLSLRQLSPKQLRQFAWLGVLPEDTSLTQDMAATLWDVTPRQAGAILRTLWSKALLLPGVKQSNLRLTYRLHDLMHDLAKGLIIAPCVPNGEAPALAGLGLTLIEAHQAILSKYYAKTQQGQWYTLPDDGYIHAYLTWHFQQAQQPNALHQLLQETTSEGRNGWYEACEKLGQTANFVTDVARSWEHAETQYANSSAQSIALQLRYALITTTLNSLASNIPSKLIAVLVEKGFWTPAQGLVYAQQAQTSDQCAAILRELAGHLPNTLLPIALQMVRQIQGDNNRADALSGLAQYLPEVIPEALAVAHQIQDNYERAKVLSKLAPHLPKALLSRALAVAHQIQDDNNRAKALSELAPYLPEVIPEALAAARQIQDDNNRAKALSELAPYLPEVIPEALAAAHQIQDDNNRAKALSELAPYLPEVIPEALAAARQIQDDNNRAKALSELAPYLPEVIPEALAAAHQIQDEESQAEALTRLVPYLPEVIPEALAAARQLQGEVSQAFALTRLVPYLPEVIPEVLAVARQIQDDYYNDRAYVLTELAPYLPKALLPEAVAVAHQIQDNYERASALSKLASYLPEVIPEAVAVAHQIQIKKDRASALSKLASYLPEVIPEAVAVAHQIQDESLQAFVLSNLAQYLPEVIPEATAALHQIEYEQYRAEALSVLVPYLPKALLSEAVIVARQIEFEDYRAEALSALVSYLPEVIPEALTVAHQIQDKESRAEALTRLVPYLPEVIPETLATVRQIQDEESRAEALTRLVPYLPEVAPEAVEVTCQIYFEDYRAEALSRLAPHLPKALLPKALEVARQTQDDYCRALALSGLVPYLPEAISEALEVTHQIENDYYRAKALSDLLDYLDLTSFELWRNILHSLACLSRKEFVNDLPKLSSAILGLGGKAALEGVVVGVREVCQQWR
ncbi:MAG: hypothetical protein KME45_24790 [Stenomitos rutilans HA7619-LM2]|jgi:hypothetical protein|nr:hypothetical protein [Stenomitos rutilans HA7619-LM2]